MSDRECVRDLARQVAELAADPANERIKQRWRDVNGLRPVERAPVWCRPVGAWPELLPPDSLTCSDPGMRSLEHQFRQTLVKREIGDDEPISSTYGVSAAFDVEPGDIWGVPIRHRSPGVAGGAWQYDPPLRTAADFDRLQSPVFTYNAAKTQERLEAAQDLLGDILPVERVCGMPMHSTMGNYIANLRGLSQMMMDMAVEPQLMHRLCAHIRDSVLASLRVAEEAGLTPNHHGPMSGSDPLAPPSDRPTPKHLWIAGNSQEFDQVSPAMWEEFCLEYQRPIIEQFGLSAYGCCENLTHKIDGVLSLRNLRIFVCSAWTDLDKVLDKVSNDYVIMWRQKATDVVFPDSLEPIRRDLEEGIRKLQGRHYQIVLRELQTLAGHPKRLHDWTRLAQELTAKYN